MSRTAEGHAQFPKVDKNFLAAMRFIWKSLRTVFALTRYGGDRFLALLGYEKREKLVLNLDGDTPLYRNASLDTRAFQNFGGVRWVSDVTVRQIEENSLYDHPEAETIRICYLIKGEQKERTYEFKVHGDLQNHELNLVGDVLATIYEELKLTENPIRTIHFADNLGKFLSPSGVPQDKVPGFSLSDKGVLLALEDMAFEESHCYRFFRKVMEYEANREAVLKKAREAMWNQRDAIVQRISEMREYTPPTARHRYGSFRGRHIIDSDTAIADGIYMGWPAREALSVDRDGEFLGKAYQSLMLQIRKMKDPLGLGFEEKILHLVINVVRGTIKLDSPTALKNFRDKHRVIQDEDVPLDLFVMEETGEAEHQALLAAYLLERVARENPDYLSGTVSLDRNWFPGEGHCWIRYTFKKRDVYIVDPKKNIVRRIDDYSSPRWAYDRASDLTLPRRQRPIILA